MEITLGLRVTGRPISPTHGDNPPTLVSGTKAWSTYALRIHHGTSTVIATSAPPGRMHDEAASAQSRSDGKAEQRCERGHARLGQRKQTRRHDRARRPA